MKSSAPASLPDPAANVQSSSVSVGRQHDFVLPDQAEIKKEDPMAWRRWVPDKKPTALRSFLVGCGTTALGLLLRIALQPILGDDYPFITFFPAILGAAVWGGLGGGLLSLFLFSAVSLAVVFPSNDAVGALGAIASFVISAGLSCWVGSVLASTVRDLRESQRRMKNAEADFQTLVSELAHRARNGITVVMAIVSQSARKGGTAAELADIVNARLSAMALAQDEVVRSRRNSAALPELLMRTLAPFDLERFVFEPSPRVEVGPETASALALLTHELATNAVKYGALSCATGSVRITWATVGSAVRLSWIEQGGPPVRPPTGNGFGTRLLGTALASQGGSAKRRFEVAGVVCDIDFSIHSPAGGANPENKVQGSLSASHHT